MSLKQIARYIARDHVFIGFERIGVAAAQLSGHFEANMQQLAKIGVVLRVVFIMP